MTMETVIRDNPTGASADVDVAAGATGVAARVTAHWRAASAATGPADRAAEIGRAHV